MKPYRNLKAGALIEIELGKMFARDFNFEGALVTILGVDVDEKLLHANVRLGIIPFEKGPGVYGMLTRHAADLHHQLVRKLNIKPVPFLKFEIVEPGKSEEVKEEPAA